MEQFFANVGVPTILVGFAVFAASKHLSSIASFLTGVTIMHFAFVAFWTQMMSMTADHAQVIGASTVATLAQPSLCLAASCARVWLGFASYSPVAHEQIASGLRWIIGGTA